MCRVSLAMLVICGGSAAAQTAGFPGNWQGTLDAGPLKMRLGMRVTRGTTGNYQATLDSIDQATSGVPVPVFQVTGNLLHFEMANPRAIFDGELAEDGSSIDGIFDQGAELPLTFHRVARIETLKRPQQPRPPFPYVAQEVSYTSGTVKLAGTLTRPSGVGPWPAVILVSGSGPHDRDAGVAGHKPFLVIAGYLARRGIASLRADDRGVGGSSGDSAGAVLDDLASDVNAGAAYLRSRKEIDANRIGAAGHGLGAYAAALAAVHSSGIAFLAMLAGAGVPGDQVMYLEGELIARASGASDEAIQDSRELQRRMVEILRAQPDEFRAIEEIRAAWADSREILPASIRSLVDAQIMTAATPQMRSFLLHDPAETLRALKIPVLAVYGSRDVQIPPSQNLPAVAAALAGNPDVTLMQLPGLNHLFQKCATCAATEYATIEETISPAALTVLGDWLVRHTRK
jgi:pimeloyl-ACP methyl ester carboxylesterase